MNKKLSIKEVASLLDCSTRTVRNYIKKGFLTPSKIEDRRGFAYRFSETEVEKLLNNLSIGNNGRKLQSWKINTISYKELYEKVESEKKELDLQLKEALVRLGQLENQRLLLTERAESLLKMEEEYRDKVEALQKELIKKEAEKEVLEKEYGKAIETLKEMLAEKDKILSKKEAEKEILAQEKENLAKKLEEVTKKKWWQFWKKPSFQSIS